MKLNIINDCSNQTDLNSQQIKSAAVYLFSTQVFDKAVECGILQALVKRL